MASDKSYMVVDTGAGRLDIKEIPSGNVINSIPLPPGASILTPPMISGDQVSYTCLIGGSVRKGFIHKVPSGNIINYFTG